MNENGKKKHFREPPSVPFIWELKPGIAKKDWKPEPEPEPEVCSFGHFPKIPLKLVASIPFSWEEKPGKPLPNFSQVSVEHVPPKPDKRLINAASSSKYSVACNFGHGDKDKGSSSDNESITSFDADDESFSSVPSLLANCLVPSAKLSTAIPLMETPSSPTSSEEDSSTTSYATGRSSPIGVTFLETLFPFYAPKSRFLQSDENMEKITYSPQELREKDFDHQDYASDFLRRPPTLGELIMMSRRRSCRRKAIQMTRWDPPKKITRKQAFGCFSIVTNSNMIEGLMKKKYFPRIKG